MRVLWIDSLKGFLIFLVVLGHVVQSMIDSNMFPSNKDGLVSLFEWIYSFHMPLFFLYQDMYTNIHGIGVFVPRISGICCSKKRLILLSYTWNSACYLES